jgi:hypothetical protein
MPSYYFVHVDAIGEAEDDEGCELPDLGAAVAMAVSAARDIMAADVRAGRLDLDQRIDIRDGQGRTMAVLAFAHALDIALPRFRLEPQADATVRERTLPSNDLS